MTNDEMIELWGQMRAAGSSAEEVRIEMGMSLAEFQAWQAINDARCREAQVASVVESENLEIHRLLWQEGAAERAVNRVSRASDN